MDEKQCCEECGRTDVDLAGANDGRLLCSECMFEADIETWEREFSELVERLPLGPKGAARL